LTDQFEESIAAAATIAPHSPVVLVSFSPTAGAQEGGFLARPKADAKPAAKGAFSHKGVQANFNVPAGGGEGGRFDKTPVRTSAPSSAAGSTAARRRRSFR